MKCGWRFWNLDHREKATLSQSVVALESHSQKDPTGRLCFDADDDDDGVKVTCCWQHWLSPASEECYLQLAHKCSRGLEVHR
ncbi:hypothetical protein P7K49_016915, partial [Saguinus oedipus]